MTVLPVATTVWLANLAETRPGTERTYLSPTPSCDNASGFPKDESLAWFQAHESTSSRTSLEGDSRGGDAASYLAGGLGHGSGGQELPQAPARKEEPQAGLGLRHDVLPVLLLHLPLDTPASTAHRRVRHRPARGNFTVTVGGGPASNIPSRLRENPNRNRGTGAPV